MQVSPVSDNNTSFQNLSVSKRTLKGLGTTKNALMENEFIKKWTKEYDFFIKGTNGSLFKSPTEFAFSIGRTGQKYLFKTLEELNKLIESLKETFYISHATSKYHKEIGIFEDIENGDYRKFIQQSDYLIPRIASIPNSPEYQKLNEYFLTMLKSLKTWIPVPKNGRRLADEGMKAYWESLNMDKTKSAPLLALENNNLELLKFFISKGENMNQCLDLLKAGLVSNEAREILKDVKYQDAKIFDLELCFDSPYLLNKFFENNANIDINSRNKDGDTLVTKAFKENNLRLLKYLEDRDDVNWNITDSRGNNLAFIALEKETVHNQCKLLRFLKNLGEEKFDINSCKILPFIDTEDKTNYCAVSPLRFAIYKTQHLIELITSFKNTDVMEQLNENDLPLILHAVEDDRVWMTSYFEALIEHPSFDVFRETSQNIKVMDFILENGSDMQIKVMKRNMPEHIINTAREIYKKNGGLSLKEIDSFLDSLISCNTNSNITNYSLNEAEETFGHLLCDIPVDINNFNDMIRMSSVVNKFLEAGGIASLPNILGMNMFAKALETENIGLIKLLKERFSVDGTGYQYILKKCKNPEILKLFKED